MMGACLCAQKTDVVHVTPAAKGTVIKRIITWRSLSKAALADYGL